MNAGKIKSNLIIQSILSIICFVIILISENKILEDSYPNWIMMLWALTLFSPLAYAYYVTKGKAENFKNTFGVSFIVQFILIIIHLLLYKHYSNLRGDAIYGGCYDCKPNYNFWVSVTCNILLLILTYKWKKLDIIK